MSSMGSKDLHVMVTVFKEESAGLSGYGFLSFIMGKGRLSVPIIYRFPSMPVIRNAIRLSVCGNLSHVLKVAVVVNTF